MKGADQKKVRYLVALREGDSETMIGGRKMPTSAGSLDVRQQEAQQTLQSSRLDHIEFLELILAERQTGCHTTMATFRELKTLEDFYSNFR